MATVHSPEVLIVMASGASPDEVDHVVARLQEAGVDARVSVGREATVIRALLVPALMRLMGRWNWWLPRRAAKALLVQPAEA